MDDSISFALLKTITNDFSDELKVASDTYGDVYKAVYDGKDIAVKRFDQGFDDDDPFRNEFRNLRELRHQNIVRLIGYSYEKRHKFVPHGGKVVLASSTEMALCYEYMHGGSLDKHISDQCCDLDWHTCFEIIIGTCVGLNHLHNAQEGPMYHLNLEPANIWLDKNMTPKIANFGLSRLFASTRTHMTSMPMGTL
ncbi:hypothetical protein BS78_09G057500 [Paspalum vaginatum]|nr:hypothetical protein BS78_09G057500 [Paspalum vaginatum]